MGVFYDLVIDINSLLTYEICPCFIYEISLFCSDEDKLNHGFNASLIGVFIPFYKRQSNECIYFCSKLVTARRVWSVNSTQ